MTSLTPEQADPDALLALGRDRGLIETRLHWRRDVILREEGSRIRTGACPQAIAALRNAMLRLVKDAPGPLRAIREAFAENRHRAIKAAQQGFL
ncbi:hypothetical protein Q8W71_13505 [Methylobacterium sp. NEAU 140]|uniref:hypothetical protein n=1 Tax=Methylobacterium sp. NEAU 140 TaxID=3064945 RepID=UPI00273518DC|nr:hypothetical protein [Methylobacterium sp. NEAU 140]MDP4023650.1 hypothetical protein [Methylobacterium sp. NEAU 140]